jgi:hypothetical protein
MRTKDLESKLNRRLKEVHRGYGVKNLKRLPNGECWFELAMSFNARDMARVNRIFADILSAAGRRRHQTVQAKFYLSTETYERLRKQAAERGIKQSALVEEALQTALA